MKFDKPELFLGQQTDSHIVMRLMNELALPNRVSIRGNQTDVHLNNYALGISLLFESERYLHAQYGIELPNDAPMLSAIFFYGKGNDEFLPFTGELVEGLALTDRRTNAHEKLGLPSCYDRDFNSDTWSFPDGIRLYVDYSEDQSTILLAQYQILFK
jgi:hypothetical protein